MAQSLKRNVFFCSSSGSIAKDILLLVAVFGVLFTFLLGHRPLATPDEGRYVEIPREMVATGDYVTPRLNGLKYFEKPPLVYWMQSLSISLFGLEHFTLRLWWAALGLLGVLGTYAVGRFALGRVAGLWSAIALGTSLLYVVLSRLIILDLPLAIFLSAALLSFWLSTQYQGIKRLACLSGWGGGMALACLTKGLIGVFLPGAIVLLWIGFTRHWGFLKNAFHPLAILVFLTLALPWHVLVALKNPEFFDFYIIQEHFLRYTTKIHNRYQPLWFFIPVLLLGFYPWTFYMVQNFTLKPWLVKEPRTKSFLTFCGCWALFIFGFFSLSSSKLIPYLIPLFPALAFGVGAFLGDLLSHPEQHFITFRNATWGWIVFTTLLGLGMLAYIPIDIEYFDRKTVPPELLMCTGTLAALLLFGALSVWILLRKGMILGVLKGILATTILFLGVLMVADPFLQPRVSIQPAALFLKKHLQPEDVVLVYGGYFQDLPVYLERTVQVVNFQGELAFGGTQEPETNQLLSKHEFKAIWKNSPKAFLVLHTPTYKRGLEFGAPYFIWWSGSVYTIVSNRPQEAM